VENICGFDAFGDYFLQASLMGELNQQPCRYSTDQFTGCTTGGFGSIYFLSF